MCVCSLLCVLFSCHCEVKEGHKKEKLRTKVKEQQNKKETNKKMRKEGERSEGNSSSMHQR